MKSIMMIYRLAFLIALLVGLGRLFHFYPMSTTLRDVHIVAGLIMLVAAVWLAIDTKQTGAWVGALLVLAGGILPLYSKGDPLSVRIFHVAIMVVAVGLAEMAASRATRLKA